MTATVSHDMRTPLNAIIGVSDNLDAEMSPRGKIMLKVVKSSAKILNFLVEDLLDFF